MLLQLIASVIRQLVINKKNNILLYPFAFHNFTPIGDIFVKSPPPSNSGCPVQALLGRGFFIANRPGPRAISASPGTTYFSPSPPSCSALRPPSVISIRDNASTQTP